MKEVKILSEFDLNREKQLLALSIDDFYFHVWSRKDHQDG